MRRPPLRNIVRREIRTADDSVVSWEVLDLSGTPIPACALFIQKLEGYAFATRKRYVEAMCRFVDYLYETGLLGSFRDSDELPTRRRVNEAMDAYVPLLLRGSAATQKILTALPDASQQTWLLTAVRNLQIQPCKRTSLDNTLAAVNRFLRLSENLAQEARDLAEQHGIELPSQYSPLINAVSGFTKLTSAQRAFIQSSSMLGGVVRMHGEIRRPAGLQRRASSVQSDQMVLDFPVAYMPALLEAATCWRDKALWLLLLASGIRRSEALNLRWSDISYERRCVYVLDPNNRRYGRFTTPEDRVRFKGRTMSWTYLWEPWRSRFFEALEEYRKREWRVPSDGKDFVFQIRKVQDGQVGVPLLYASDAALNQSFKTAVKRARIPVPGQVDGESWTPHSLRHAYGVYMLNYIPVAPGVFGFPETDVQALLGHESIVSTRRYARREKDVLRAKLEYADQMALGYSPNVVTSDPCLPNQLKVGLIQPGQPNA